MPTTITNKNVPLIHRKEFQMMTPPPVTPAAAMFITEDATAEDNLALYMTSNTVHYLYHHDEDAWVQIPSAALGGTFQAGSCGTRARFSTTITANGGSTTTATTATAINGLCIGKTIRFLTGANAGLEATITNAIIPVTGTSTIQFAALANAVSNTDTFVINTGRFFIWNSGTMSATSYKVYDPLLGTWSSLSVTAAPASWANDGRLVSTPSNYAFATGTATAGGASTLTNAAKTWTTNQWTSYQIRITAGTGIGQIRTIASNTGTAITVSSAWATQPDATSVYSIEGNDDFLYLLGNNAVTMYRYSISGNSWSTLSPTAARGSATGLGFTANWVGKTDDTNWANESTIQDGRYIYSFQGGGTTGLHRYDIAVNTWATITQTPAQTETFTTGTSAEWHSRYIYLRKDGSNRFFKYSVRGNYLEPLATNLYTESTPVLGQKIWMKNYEENNVEKLAWIYALGNSVAVTHRMLLI
jgi:hypothetical protein